MIYARLKEIFDVTPKLAHEQRYHSFSDGVKVISKYCYSDRPNLQVVDGEIHWEIHYGCLDEVLSNLTEDDAKTLARNGWEISNLFDATQPSYFTFKT